MHWASVIKPCVSSFEADQFDDTNPVERTLEIMNTVVIEVDLEADPKSIFSEYQITNQVVIIHPVFQL